MENLFQSDLASFSNIGQSFIEHHGQACCRRAQETIIESLTDPEISAEMASVSETIDWSPTYWPAYWCRIQANDSKLHGDCGVHAAITRYLLDRRGIANQGMQIAIRSSKESRENWTATWNKSKANSRWIGKTSVYHEVVSIGERLWDPSEARWFLGLGDSLIAGQVVAIRSFAGKWNFDERLLNKA